METQTTTRPTAAARRGWTFTTSANGAVTVTSREGAAFRFVDQAEADAFVTACHAERVRLSGKARP